MTLIKQIEPGDCIDLRPTRKGCERFKHSATNFIYSGQARADQTAQDQSAGRVAMRGQFLLIEMTAYP
jgi:hypothetical protein